MHKLKKIIKKVKIRNLLILIMLLLFNTYAWFVYSTKVNMNISAHVSSWNVRFISDEQEVTTEIDIVVDRIFPGMEGEKAFEKVIEVKNNGEKSAVLSYNIQEITIMGEKYSVDGENAKTEDEIKEILDSYPFKIKIDVDDSKLQDNTGDGKITIRFEWPFESGNDELDTYWGNKAYEYYSVNPDKNSVELKVLLNASQKAE